MFNSVKYDYRFRKKYQIDSLIFANIKITLQFYMKNVCFMCSIVNTAGSKTINVQNSSCPIIHVFSTGPTLVMNTAWFPRWTTTSDTLYKVSGMPYWRCAELKWQLVWSCTDCHLMLLQILKAYAEIVGKHFDIKLFMA